MKTTIKGSRFRVEGLGCEGFRDEGAGLKVWGVKALGHLTQATRVGLL